jgi:acylphosphatase
MEQCAVEDEVFRILVSGRVQGVGYREFTRSTARRLGIAGWVRNRSNGQVEALVRIPPGRKAAFLTQLRQGPPLSQVDDVAISPASADQDCPPAGFTIRH